MAKNPEFTRLYKSDDFTVWARPNSCFFCKNCAHILWDYTNGPYLWMCDVVESIDEDGVYTFLDTNIGMEGKCSSFDDVDK